MPNFILNVVVLLAALFISSLAFEGAVRLIYPAYNPANQIQLLRSIDGKPVLGPPNSDVYHVTNRGDFNVKVHFNGYGFRDQKDLKTAQENAIFVIGDSFSFGWGVEEDKRYSNQLEKLTDRRLYNLSTPGDLFNGVMQLQYAKRLGAPIKNVILGLTVENDILPYPAAAPQEAAPPSAGGGFNIDTGKNFKSILLRNSAAYFFTTSLVHQSEWLRGMLTRLGLIAQFSHTPVIQASTDAAIQSSLGVIAEINQSYNLTVLIIPSRALWIGEKKVAAALTHSKIVAGLKSANIHFVDPRDQMERGGTPLSYHFENDGHWTVEGHRLAAEMLSNRDF